MDTENLNFDLWTYGILQSAGNQTQVSNVSSMHDLQIITALFLSYTPASWDLFLLYLCVFDLLWGRSIWRGSFDHYDEGGNDGCIHQ